MANNHYLQVEVKIKGWRQSEEYFGGHNPWCDTYTYGGVVVDCKEMPELIGRFLWYEYHGSYNGVYRHWRFTSEETSCPKREEVIPSTKLRNAGTQYSWKEGDFNLKLEGALQDFESAEECLARSKKLREEYRRMREEQRRLLASLPEAPAAED